MLEYDGECNLPSSVADDVEPMDKTVSDNISLKSSKNQVSEEPEDNQVADAGPECVHGHNRSDIRRLPPAHQSVPPVPKPPTHPQRLQPCSPYDLLCILRDPKCTDQHIQQLVTSGRVNSALLAHMHPSDFKKAGISDFVLRRLLSHISQYENRNNPPRSQVPQRQPRHAHHHQPKHQDRLHHPPARHNQRVARGPPISGPPPGFSGAPKYREAVQEHRMQHMLQQNPNFIGSSNYERDMLEISNQMTMNVLD